MRRLPESFVGEAATLVGPVDSVGPGPTPVRAFRLKRKGFDRCVSGALRRAQVKPHVAVDREQTH